SLDKLGCFPRDQSKTARNPDDMPVGNHRRHPEANTENRIGGLATNPRQGEQLRHRLRDRSPVALEENPAGRYQGSGFGSEKSNRAKNLFNVARVSRSQWLWAWIPLQEFASELVGHRVGALRREDDGDQ